MTDLKIYHYFSMLPENMKNEVETFIQFLLHKQKEQNKISKRQFGFAKGKIKIMPDFDEPLEDFQAYM